MKLLALTLLAAPLFAGAIQVSGGGTFENDPLDVSGEYTATFSGSDGTDNVSVGYDADFAGGIPNSISSGFPMGGFARVDGTLYNTDSFTFEVVGDGSSGFISVFDSSHSLVNTLQLTGYIFLTSEVCEPGGILRACSGSYSIVGTPEPAALFLSAVGLAGLALRRLHRC